MARSWHVGLPPSLYQFYSSETLVVDVLSPLLGIISPPIKPAAIHLLATEDRKALLELVDTMIALGLRYTQTATEEGGYAFRLDPPIHQLLPMSNTAAASSSQGMLR